MNKKILVIHQGALGDLVLSFPALLLLKQENKAYVTLLCSSVLGKLAYDLSVVHDHFALERAYFSSLFGGEMTPAAKKFISDYDILILVSFSDGLQHHLRQNHGGKVYKISPRPPVEQNTHVALHVIRQLREKRLLKNAGRLLPFQSKPVSISAATDGRLSCRQRSIVIHPGAGSPRKRWPVAGFIQTAATIEALNLGVVSFMVGPAESDLASFIKAGSKGAFPVYEVQDLSQVMALLRRATGFIGNDSGVTHLAAFMGIPTVAVFGPSSPNRWMPVGRETKVLRGAADCSPCFETAQDNCEAPECLNEVSVDMVVDALKEITLLSQD